MRRASVSALAVVVLALGVAAAMFATPQAHAAGDWSWGSLPNGYGTSVVNYSPTPGTNCHQVSIDGHYMGDDCTDPAGLQANVNSYVDSTICTRNPAAGQSHGMCFPQPTTTDAPAATTSTDGTTTTSASPPVTTTVTGPGATTTVPGGTTPTVTDTTSTTPTCDITCLEARIAALEKQYADLAHRVDAIQQANTASWDAFSQVIADGGSVADAAAAARSAGLNAIYLL